MAPLIAHFIAHFIEGQSIAVLGLFFQPNHLIGIKQRYLKLSFLTVNDLMKVRPQIMSAVKKNREREKGNTYYSELLSKALATNSTGVTPKFTDHMDNIIDIRYCLFTLSFTL